MEVCQLHWLQSARAERRNASAAPTVLIAENSPRNQSWLAPILIQAFPGASLVSTSCVRESLNALASATVHIAVVELHLPDGSGIDLVRACSRVSPWTGCVVATPNDSGDYLVPVFAAGAVGYVLKNQPETVLIQQMRLLAEGVPPLAPSIAQRLVRHFMQQRVPHARVPAPEIDSSDNLARLSQRERQVLALIAKGMHLTEVAHLLNIATNTVCSHVKSIYRKRNVSSRAEAAIEAQRLGLV